MNTNDISHLIFDVDGTLYDKQREYIVGHGSIEDSHEFFRYATYSRARAQGNILDEAALIEEVGHEYRKKLRGGQLIDAIRAYSEEIKREYTTLVKKHGSNGKVFVNEFGTDSRFFAQIVGKTDFENILAEDRMFTQTLDTLRNRGYSLGILTTEVFSTVETVARVMGFSLDTMAFENYKGKPELISREGTNYPILCSENVKDKKPSREGFDKIMSITGAPASNIVYVGDHIKKDVSAPLALGMNAIHVNYRDNSKAIRDMQVNPHMHGCDEDKKYKQISTIYQLVDIFGERI
ncbi:MAG: HAD family hydrolase [Candidatus Woesearchaeota archaeon]